MKNEKEQKNDGLAVTALVFGLLSIFTWEFSIVPILAIIFGAFGIYRTSKEKKSGMTMAIWGVVLGVIFLIVRVAQGV